MRTENEPQNRVRVGRMVLTDSLPLGSGLEVRIIQKPLADLGQLTHVVEIGHMYIRKGVFGVEEVPMRDHESQCSSDTT